MSFAEELKFILSGFHWIVVPRLWLQPAPEPDAAGGRGHDHWPGGGGGCAGQAAPAPPRQLQPHAEAGGEVTLRRGRGQGQPQASDQPGRGRDRHQDTALRHNEHEVRLHIVRIKSSDEQCYRTFRSASDIRHDSATSDLASRDCGLACPASWLYWLDPGHWLDTVWPQTRVLILATIILGAVIILSVIIRTCCCVAKLCSKKRKLDKSTLKILLDKS